MRIFFIVPYVPNLIRVRPYNLIRNLTSQGHQVTVMTLSTNEAAEVEKLKDFCSRVYAFELPTWRSLFNAFTALPGDWPLQASYCWNPFLADSSIELLGGASNDGPFDVIHIEHLRGARYGLNLLEHIEKSNLKIPIVWDSVDCITYLFEQACTLSQDTLNRWVTRFELERTRQFESYLVSRFEQVLVTSEKDRHALVSLNQSHGKKARVTVLPNGVDLSYFQPDEGRPRETETLVVSGKMSYHANVTMVKYLVNKIMPIVWERKPGVKLWIVGKNLPNEIRELAKNPAITITGTVADIRPYLQSATLAVAPVTYGAGIQNKILEAMACATPVVTTPQAIVALDVQPGRDLLVGGSPAEISEKILLLLEDPDQRRKIGENGRRLVEKNHNWGVITARLTGIYAESCKKSRNLV